MRRCFRIEPPGACVSDHATDNSSRASRNRDFFASLDNSDSIGDKAASGGMISIFGQLVRMVLLFAASAILARLLTPEEFGLVAMATTVTAFIGVFTDLGLSAATVQRAEIDSDIVSGLFLVNIAVGLLVMLVAFAIAPLAAWALGEPRIVPVIAALGLAIPITAAGAQHNALLQRRMRWISLQATTVGSQALGALVAVLVAAYMHVGYWALVVQVLVAALSGLVINWSLCSWRPAFVTRWAPVRESLTFGFHLTGFNLLNYFHRQFDNLLVGWRWGATQLGHYSRAYGLFMLPLNALGFPLGAAVVPAMSRLQTDPDRWRRLYLTAIASLTLLTSPLAGCFVLLAEPLTLAVYGPQWREAIPMFRVLALSIVVQPVYSSGGWIFVSLGRTGPLARAGLVATVWYCAAFLIGLPFGARGVATAYTCAVVLLAPPWLWWAARGTSLSLFDIGRVVSPPILGALLSLVIAASTPTPVSSAAHAAFFRTGVFVTCFLLVLGVCSALFPFWRAHLRPSIHYLHGVVDRALSREPLAPK